jgi:hypothetical protein
MSKLCNFPKNSHTPQQQESQECKKATITKKKRLQEILQQAATNVQFFLGQEKIQKKCQFKYLGRIITETDNDLAAVQRQIQNARKSWLKINKIVKNAPTTILV